jgi:putative flippase GtrA
MKRLASHRVRIQDFAQFARFIAIGLVNTAIGFGIFAALQLGAGWSPFAANLTGYAVGWLVSYTLNRRFTFRSGRSHGSAVPRFVFVAALAFGLNALVLFACLELLSFPPLVAQAIAMIAYTLFFYLLSRYVVFNHR